MRQRSCATTLTSASAPPSRPHAACCARAAQTCCSYPPSLLRIISSRRFFTGDGGLQQFLDSDDAWRYKFPATFMFYGDAACDVSALADRPNFFKSTDAKQCKAFALFKPLAAMSR